MIERDNNSHNDPQGDPSEVSFEYSTRSLAAAVQRSDNIWDAIYSGKTDDFRILTGDRTTGALHIGHYFGSLQNRVKLQDLGVETFILLADYQALTDRDASDALSINVRNIVLDYLAVGLNPAKTVFFAHSFVAALNQLLIPFLGVVSVSELHRNPTVKDEINQLGTRSVSGLMLTYPVHQAADILFCRANLVPGGKDQLPHIEITRTIARRINQRYFDYDFFPEPDLLISELPLLLGVDGRKMSKSLGNAIEIRSSEDETTRLIKGAKTDSQRLITYDPENRPEIANLLRLLSVTTDRSPQEWAVEIGDEGSGILKKHLIEAVNEYFRPIRQRRKEWEGNLDHVWDILASGVERANEIANKTLQELRTAMGMAYF